MEPRVLLLDEPLSNLDLKLRQRMRFELRQIFDRLRITTILVTHDQTEALEMADRVAVLNQGKLEQVGTPSDIYERPATSFVADFVGETNFFTGRVNAADASQPSLHTPNGLVLVLPDSGREYVGTTAVVSIRPEQMMIRTSEPPPANAFRGVVVTRTYRGSTVHLGVELEGSEAVFVDVDCGDAPPAIGDEVTVAWEPEAAVCLGS